MRALLLVCLAVMSLAACSTTLNSVTQAGVPVSTRAAWALLPMQNHTDTPQAGLAAEAIVEHLLRARGIDTLTRYPATLSRDTLFEPSERRVEAEARQWAKGAGARYGVTGAVEEWRYKVGIDGEPAVGVTLQVIDLESGAVLWSASGARAGWSREALAGVANRVLADLVAAMALENPVR